MFKDGDNWLDRWFATIRSASNGQEILELGCGEGRDTRQLWEAGLQVIGVDKSKDAIDIAAPRNPGCSFHIGDIRSYLANGNAYYPAVIASLCLHYFTWEETLEIVGKIHSSLIDGGLLLVRVNSTDDVNYGSVGNKEIETNFYQVGDREKRFFDENALESIFFTEDWDLLLREKNTIYRYEKPKSVWELVLSKQ
ncbi:MAG: trans-aconitate 2-methyltransferase [Granulosicoccus sp.]